jgi:predicted nucleic acid-binding protein
MLVVSNTSPIANLAFINRLDLLRDQFDRLWIPEAVRAELDHIPDPAAKVAIEQASQAGWMKSRPIENLPLAAVLGNELDRGEAEAIALSIEMKADLLLIDEREGRIVARQAGLRVRGVLGILLRAKATGKIPSIRTEIEALRNRAGFFVAPRLEAEILRSAGE